MENNTEKLGKLSIRDRSMVERGRERYVSHHPGEESEEDAHGFHVEFVGLGLRRVRDDYIDDGFYENEGRLSVGSNECVWNMKKSVLTHFGCSSLG